jgi:peptidoglycan/LPS O-acetylase OafA/YrhL
MSSQGPRPDAKTRQTTTRHWILEVRGPWRWAAIAIGLVSGLGCIGMFAAAGEGSPEALVGLILVIPFGALMSLLGVRGAVRVPLGTTIEVSHPE